MSIENSLWGAPRIHGELLKLGIDVGQTQCGKIHGAEEGTAVSGLEDVSAQSRGWHRRDGSVRGANRLVPLALLFADHRPWTSANSLVRGDCAEWIANQLTEAVGWEQAGLSEFLCETGYPS